MSKDGTFQLTRRKALAGIGTVGVASAGAGLGTSAFFSDTESFDGNSITAGSLDLKVDWQQRYYGAAGWLPVNAYPDHDGDGWQSIDDDTEYQPGSPITLTCDDLESGADLPEGVFEAPNRTAANGGPITDQDSLISLEDVKPGDMGEVTFSLHLCDNPGYLWMFGEITNEAENGITEPEAEDDDEEETEPRPATEDSPDDVVELADEIRVTLWYDTDCDNELDEDETIIVGGAEDPANNPTLRDVLNNLGDANGIPLTGDIPSSEGGGTGRNCFSGDTQHCIGFKWELPVDHANEIQSDSVEFDLGFYGEQCRHNDGQPNGDDGLDVQDFSQDLSTGVNPDWQVVSSPDGTTGDTYASGKHPAWATVNTSMCNAQWIDPYGNSPTESDPVGDYVYELEFDVPSPSPRDLAIYVFGSDNPGRILLDGTEVHSHQVSDAYNPLNVTTVTEENISIGSHTLRAEVRNESGSGQNPTGLFVCAWLV